MAGELSGSATISIVAGHKKTSRPEEYVHLKINKDANGVIQSYSLDEASPGHHDGQSVPVLTNPITGVSEQPSTTYNLKPATESNIFLETEHTFTQGKSEQHLWGSERAYTVTRWRSVYPDLGYDVEWLCRNGPQGLGAGLSGSEGISEYHDTVADQVPYRSFQNPTHGGARGLPAPAAGTYTLDDLKNQPVSCPIHYKVDGSSIQGAVIPLDFAGDETVAVGLNATNHGGNSTTAVLYWRHKRLERVQPHLGGREHVHRATYWSYQPLGWDAADFGGDTTPPLSPVRLNTRHATAMATLMQGAGFDTFRAADLGAANPSFTIFTEFDDGSITNSGAWRFSESRTQLLDDIAGPDDPPQFPSGYCMVLISRSSDGFSVGFAWKMSTTPPLVGKLGLTTTPNQVTVRRRQGTALTNSQVSGVSIPDTVHGSEVIISASTDSFLGRLPGWTGFHTHIFTGPLSVALDTGLELLGAGVLDAEPEFSIIPSQVLEGTIAATPAPSTSGRPAGPGGPGPARTGVMPGVISNQPMFGPKDPPSTLENNPLTLRSRKGSRPRSTSRPMLPGAKRSRR